MINPLYFLATFIFYVFLPVGATALEVFQWTAPDGTVTFSNKPPESARQPVKVLTYEDPAPIETPVKLWETGNAGETRNPGKKPAKRLENRRSKIKFVSNGGDVPDLALDSGKLPRIKIYTTAACTYCRMAKAYMEQLDIRYSECDIEKSLSCQKSFKSAGGRGVPLILAGKERMNGFSPHGFNAFIKRAAR